MPHPSQLPAAFAAASNRLTSTPQEVVGISTRGDAFLQDCRDQAEICCEQAREAATMRRLCAACGLFSTAIALYRHILQAGSAVLEERTRQKIEENMHEVEQEMAIYETLSRSKSRPFTYAAAHRAIMPVT